MARGINRLRALDVRNASTPGVLHDGGGLYLQITHGPNDEHGRVVIRKSWLLRYTSPVTGARREMGLGPLQRVPLADARVAAEEARRGLAQGIDPIEARDVERAAKAAEAARSMTFTEAATAYIAAHRARWRNAKHGEQWTATLTTYAYPVIGKLPVGAVDVPLVLKVLRPIWATKTETANRVRGRIEAILDWAMVSGHRAEGPNPAAWKGRLQKALPARSDVQKVKHRAALPYMEAGAFMARLRSVEGLSALALQLTVLCATRTNETLQAAWSEFDLSNALWTVPSNRTKSGREHRIPLSRQAVALLTDVKALGSPHWVFPGNAPKKGAKRPPLSNMAMLMALQRMAGCEDLTVHGFRSCFRTWAGEATSFPREVAEMALAHVIADATEAAYARGDLFQKRRRLMQAWADYLDRPAKAAGDNVRQIGGKPIARNDSTLLARTGALREAP